jgi:hypothetical protein
MKLKFFIGLIVFLAVVAGTARPQQAQKPLTKDQVMELAKAGMETPDLVKLIHEHGIDFDSTDDYLQALRQAGAQEPVIEALRAARPKPLSKEQVLKLLTGHVPNDRAAALVGQHGIDFRPDEQYFEMLRLAGADDTLVDALRTAGEAVTAQLEVETSPNAEVYLDGQFVGRADADGRLAAKSKPGAHALKVSFAGKQDFEQKITLIAGQNNKLAAALVDLPGSIRIHSAAGAEVFLDGASRGTTDAIGQLAVPEVVAGSHELRISARGKKEFQQIITVPTGQAAGVEAPLADLGPAPGAKGYLGLQIGDLDDYLAKQFNVPDASGALAEDVTAGGPADKAGVKTGDVIRRLNGEVIKDSAQLTARVTNLSPGTSAALDILRDGRPLTLEATLGERPAGLSVQADAGSVDHGTLRGVSVENLTLSLRGQWGVPPSVTGVVIFQIDPKSLAAQNGLQVGDVIESISRQPVQDVSDFDRLAARAKGQTLLRINRQGDGVFVVISPSEGGNNKQ